MKSYRLLALIAVCCIALITWAAPRTAEQMKAAAVKAINIQRAGKHMAPKKATELQTLAQTTAYHIIGQSDGGFAIISTDDLVPEVLGVSMSKYSNGKNTNFQWWLKAIEGTVQYAVTNNVQLATTKPDPAKYPTSVAPLITTKWDQLTPYNNLLPLSNGGDRCYTGCVATAMAQVLKYHEYPERGIGTRTIYYPQYSTNGKPITATFEDDVYDWKNMLDIYSSGNYDETQALAVATLMRDCGVAADMQYGGYKESGSGAYSQDAAAGLRTYFGLTEAECLERDYYSESDWMDIVYRELSENGPLYYGGASWSSGGHAFVLHGYNESGKVYVNWGWSGDDDGYYDIALLNPSYYYFNMEQDMIIGIKGAPRELNDYDITLTEAGMLNEQLSDEVIGSVGKLKISGNINSTDLLQIRKLAGIDQNGVKTDGRLYELDLSDAQIVAGGIPYLIENDNEYNTANNELPTKAFYGCKYLRKLLLPTGIKAMGDGAIGNCPLLNTLEFGEIAEDASFSIDENGFVWNPDKTELIAVLPTITGKVIIPAETTELHDYAMAGCANVTQVTLPKSITKIGREGFCNCSALKTLRIASKDIPELGGPNVFAGVSVYNCKIYVPSGCKTKYANTEQWKDFIGSSYDNIIEYGTTLVAHNAKRNYGDENPRFSYIVKGQPLTGGTPVFSCDATPLSPAGTYVIHISAGSITNDMVEYEDGILTVKKVDATATVDDATRMEGDVNPDFTLTYNGLKNGETEPVWTVAPVFICEADETSPAGTYTITVEGGEAESYNISFTSGKLTVEESTTAIKEILNSIKAMKDVYTIDGKKMDGKAANTLPNGVYIVNGYKVVVK